METKSNSSLFAYLLFLTASLALARAQSSSTWPAFRVGNLTAFGASDQLNPLVWYDNVNFRDLIKPKSSLQLIDRQKTNCAPRCEACDLAWKVERNNLQVALFFRDPVQLSRIFIKQVKNSGVSKVQLIKWTYPPQGRIDASTLGRVLVNNKDDSSMCQGVQIVRIPDNRSGITQAVPASGSQEALPASLASTAVGGVLITMKQAPNAADNYGPFVEYVRFAARVLYPRDAGIYAGVKR